MPTHPLRLSLLAFVLASLLSQAGAAELPTAIPDPSARPTSQPIAIEPRALDAAKGYLRLDVRGTKEYAAGHLPGAVRLDLGELSRLCPERDPAEAICLRAALGELGVSGDLPAVVYGADLEFAARAFLRLESAGWRTVRVLDGGWGAWLAAGLPVARKVKALPARSFGAGAEREVLLEPRLAFARLVANGGPGVQLLDLRDGGDWALDDYEAPPAFRAGHAPGSLPWDPRGGLPSSGRLPEALADRAAFERIGPPPGFWVDPATTFLLLDEGTSAPRQAIAYLRLRAMGLPVRVVRGGFAAWQAARLALVRIVDGRDVLALIDPAALAGNRPAPFPILDLRELADYDAGHIPGAAPLPLALLSTGSRAIEAAVAARWSKLDQARTPLVLVGYDRTCDLGRKAAVAAAGAGFRDIVWLRDGMEAWRTEGLPIAR